MKETFLECNGGANQRFTLDTSDETLRLRSYPVQAVDEYAPGNGADVGTWRFWSGDNQHWTIVP